jgi:hypothetical protein
MPQIRDDISKINSLLRSTLTPALTEPAMTEPATIQSAGPHSSTRPPEDEKMTKLLECLQITQNQAAEALETGKNHSEIGNITTSTNGNAFVGNCKSYRKQ